MRDAGGAIGTGGRPAEAPVEAKVVLIDPERSVVTWMNEAAAGDLPTGRSGVGLPLADAVPLSVQLGLGDAVSSAVGTGEAVHREISLVSTARGSLTIVASVYRLPSGDVLIVMDRTFQAGPSKGAGTAPRRARRP